MTRLQTALRCAALALALWTGVAAADTDTDRADAVSRVVDSHDTTLLLGGGLLMVKQSAIRSARKLLTEWGREAGLRGEWWDDAAEYRAAKAALLQGADEILQSQYVSGAWLKEVWTQYTARELDGEQADTVATHFQTEGGKKLRQLMDWYLGEMVLANYTFTDRFDYELKDSERELIALQKEAQKRIPREDIEFTSRYPDTFQFVACSPDSRYCPSLKYWKMLIYPLMGEIFRYTDSIGVQIEADMRKRKPQVDAYIAEFKARRK